MAIFYKIWKKYNEIQLAKNEMDLNNRKMKNHPPSPDNSLIKKILFKVGINCINNIIYKYKFQRKALIKVYG